VFAIGQPALDHTVSRPVDGIAAGEPAIERTASLVRMELAPYTIPSRLAIWSDAVRIFEISPVVGVGYHNYFIYSRVTEIKDASRFDVPDLFSSLIKQGHNDFLSWLAETGGVGFALYLAFWGLILILAWRLWRAEPHARERNTFTLVFMVSLLGVSIFGELLVPRTPDWTSSAALWWITIGLLFIDAGRQREIEQRASH
jgi:O-antigen ligase